MAVKEPEFLLPPEFLTADDVLAGYLGSFEKTGVKTKPDPDLRFPAEFPYDLCSSPAASTGTESDEEDFLAELTRRLTRSSLDDTHKSTSPAQNHFESWLLSGSPETTLARVGSWSGMSVGSGSPNGPSQISSPTTPLAAKSVAWDLILLQAAAGQVARMKMRGGDELPATRTFAPLLPPHAAVQNVRLHKPVDPQMVKHQQQGCAMWDNGCYIEPPPFQARASRAVFGTGGGAMPFVENGRYGRPVVGGASHAAALRSLHFQHQTQSGRPAMPFCGSAGAGTGGFGMKKERSGTGVFLPRKYGNNSSNKPMDSGNKTGCCNTTAKVVVHGLHKNFEDINNGPVQPRINGVFVSDYEMLIARRNAAVLAQQRRNFRQELAISHEICLPQEWTY